MRLVSMRQLLDHAAENAYGLPAFKVNNLEQVRAIMEAADETGSSVIHAGLHVRKINIDTDVCLAMTGAIRKHMFEKPSEFDPRKYLADAQAAARGICKLRYEAFGCAGQAARIKPLALEKMADRYRKGELSPVVN